jgi:hypothetical protein
METKDLISSVIEKQLEEKLESALEKGIETALNDLFSRYGGVKSQIEDKLKEIVLPVIEGYDFNKFIPKLDYALTEIVNSINPDYKTIVENFKEFAKPFDFGESKILPLSKVFETYCKFCSTDVDASDLQVDYYDEPSFEYLDVNMEVETLDSVISSWETKRVLLTCDQDENLTVEFEIYSILGNSKFDLRYSRNHSIKSLKYVNKFDLFLLKLSQAGIEIRVDKEDMCEEVEVDRQPELQDVTYG